MGLFHRLFRRQRLFTMQPADLQMWQNTRLNGIQNVCDCFIHAGDGEGCQHPPVSFHTEKQDTSGEAWKVLEDLVEAAASNGSREFNPGLQMPPELWAEIITLPA